jgi:hypothetical protein
MKNKALYTMMTVLVMMSAMPLYAAVEGMSVAPQTLGEFQRIYSGTKPVVAASEYQASKYVTRLPQPTLTISRIRTEDVEKGQGTKPGIFPAFGSSHRWTGGKVTSSKPPVLR